MPLRVLLIDDDDDLRVEILEYLRRRRHDVTGCASIAEAGDAVARQIAAAQPPQAVICDLHLADGNFNDSARALDARSPGLQLEKLFDRGRSAGPRARLEEFAQERNTRQNP